MCGIVGILGEHEAAPVLVAALKRLEYRGYDSAGIATVNAGHLDRRRAVGKLANLSDLLVHDPLAGKAGIGHTRWATHGAASEKNAHPHRAGRVAVVHNGIIENYRDLRAWLAERGIGHETDTDTETVALVAQVHLDAGATPEQAVDRTLAMLTGAYALLFLFDGEENLMIAARRGSPLAIGHGDGEMYVGSDAIALSDLTDRITYLDEGDRATITRAGAAIRDADGRPVDRPVRTIAAESLRVDKGGHRHFMAKEIAEQPAALTRTLGRHLGADGLPALPAGADLSGIDRVVIVACGTAHYAAHVARYWFEEIAGIPVDLDVASEFRYREPPVPPRTAAILVSQSGETADTLAALRYLTGKAARIIAVVNVPESSIARESGIVLPIEAGPEIGVASTKAFTCQLMTLAIMALAAGAARGRDIAGPAAALARVPGLVNVALGLDTAVQALATRLAEARDILFLGRGRMYPIALEGALKLKEISYIHAEGYAAGELKHGPIALIDQNVPVIVMAPHDGLFDKTLSNMQEVMARGGQVLLVTDAPGAAAGSDGVWQRLVLPACDPLWAPIVHAVPVQMIAYHTALARGTDVDQPRNLAKSVTVE